MNDVDSKARDLVDDSKELVVGKWYEFAKKIEVERNQYATSLRISGKSGNVYRYTIYLKNIVGDAFVIDERGVTSNDASILTTATIIDWIKLHKDEVKQILEL